MPELKSYTAYYKPIPLRFWFYFWCVIISLLVGLNIFLLATPSDKDPHFWKDWLVPAAHFMIYYTTIERLYKQYKNSKIKHCFIKVDSDGISWRLPKVNYDVKESEIIVWRDVKKIVIDENTITVKYMSTYFSDNIPFDTITAEDKALLIEALNDQIQCRSIPYENQMAA